MNRLTLARCLHVNDFPTTDRHTSRTPPEKSKKQTHCTSLPSCHLAKQKRQGLRYSNTCFLLQSLLPAIHPCRHATFHHLTAMIQIHLYLHILPRFHDNTIWTWHESGSIREKKVHKSQMSGCTTWKDSQRRFGCSYSKHWFPKPVVLTTLGGESDISYPSRLISSMRMPNCISPRPRISK